MEGKSSTQGERFFSTYLPNENFRMSDGSDFENFLSPNCSNWSKISQIGTKVGFSEKKLGFSSKKELDFFRIRKGGKFAVECVLNDNIS